MFTSDWNRAAKILNWFIYIYSLRNHYPLNAFSWTGHKSISIPVDGYWWPNLSHTSMMEQSVCVCVSEENVESAASLSRSSLEVREQTHSSYGCLRAPPQNANINRHPAKHVAVMYHVGLCTQQVAWMRCWLWCGWVVGWWRGGSGGLVSTRVHVTGKVLSISSANTLVICICSIVLQYQKCTACKMYYFFLFSYWTPGVEHWPGTPKIFHQALAVFDQPHLKCIYASCRATIGLI